LIELIRDHPNEVAAYQQLGQSYWEHRETAEARNVLRAGVEKAKEKGDLHAAAEMEGLLAEIG
jgi:hypothetical protein